MLSMLKWLFGRFKRFKTCQRCELRYNKKLEAILSLPGDEIKRLCLKCALQEIDLYEKQSGRRVIVVVDKTRENKTKEK